MQQARKILKRFLFGKNASLVQKVDFALYDPQSEVDVWLHGPNGREDVTHTHLMACGAPLTICIGFNEPQDDQFHAHPVLRFHEHAGARRFLGEIGLRFVSSFQVGSQHLCLFHVSHHKNACLSPLRLWAHYLHSARGHRKTKEPDVPITTRETRAMTVFYLCPRPVALVTVDAGDARNMFPMNLMGCVGNGYFAFALNSSRAASPLVERARRVVLSSVPLEKAAVVAGLGSNHRKQSIDWSQLPFKTVQAKTIDAPVAEFALKIRELQIEAIRRLGSHTLFVAKTIAEDSLAPGPQLFGAHGMYHAWLQNSKRKA